MSDIQHKDWFIAVLLTHIKLPLMQQKIAMQSEALEIPMKLETSPVGENVVNMSEIQMQLENLTLKISRKEKITMKRCGVLNVVHTNIPRIISWIFETTYCQERRTH